MEGVQNKNKSYLYFHPQSSNIRPIQISFIYTLLFQKSDFTLKDPPTPTPLGRVSPTDELESFAAH